MSPRFFSLAEANAMIPYLSREFAQVASLRPEISELTRALGGAEVALGVLNGERPAPEGLEEPAARLVAITEEVKNAAVRIGQMGCVVKDLDLGLVDFYGRLEGRAVFLCWQFGEAAIGHWHELDGSFATRQELKANRAAQAVN